MDMKDKKIIRNRIFETNSSSTHAICICTDSRLLKDIEYPNELFFGISDHGWEFETLKTSEQKADYLYTAILCIYEDKKERNQKINKIYQYLLDIDVLAKFEDPIYDEYGWLENGSVDHAWELENFINSILKSSKLLYKYLFSNYSFVEKGNDNSDRDVDIKVDYDHKEFHKWN